MEEVTKSPREVQRPGRSANERSYNNPHTDLETLVAQADAVA